MIDYDKLFEAYFEYVTEVLTEGDEEKKAIAKRAMKNCGFTVNKNGDISYATFNIPFFDYKFHPWLLYRVRVCEDKEKVYLSDFGQVYEYWREELTEGSDTYADEIEACKREYGLSRKRDSFQKELENVEDYRNTAKELDDFIQAIFRLIHIDTQNG